VNTVDIVVIASAVVFAWSGWRQGFISGLLSFVGFIGGGLLGTLIAPRLVSIFVLSGITKAIVMSGIVFLCAGLGQVGLAVIARYLRKYLLWRPARMVDNVAGAVLNVVALAVVCWIVASAVATLPNSGLAREIRASVTLGAMDRVVPNQARDWFGALQRVFDQSGVPRVFAGFSQAPPAAVAAPDPTILRLKGVMADLGSVVKVSGVAEACRSQITGSGFVFAPQHVMTNAHVVLGVAHPVVRVRGTGPPQSATVVYLDTRTDVAVLYVPGLAARSLPLAGRASNGTDAVVVGFPGGGPLTLTAARVREIIRAVGTDLYGRPGVEREVYSLRAGVHPGNSGGPLLDTHGRVLGVVFATSIDDPQTGYALTDAQVAGAVREGTATAEVSSGSCLNN
jgi:S1-C subfamily serine protease